MPSGPALQVSCTIHGGGRWASRNCAAAPICRPGYPSVHSICIMQEDDLGLAEARPAHQQVKMPVELCEPTCGSTWSTAVHPVACPDVAYGKELNHRVPQALSTAQGKRPRQNAHPVHKFQDGVAPGDVAGGPRDLVDVARRDPAHVLCGISERASAH